jgi:hypothetical protein
VRNKTSIYKTKKKVKKFLSKNDIILLYYKDNIAPVCCVFSNKRENIYKIDMFYLYKGFITHYNINNTRTDFIDVFNALINIDTYSPEKKYLENLTKLEISDYEQKIKW